MNITNAIFAGGVVTAGVVSYFVKKKTSNMTNIFFEKVNQKVLPENWKLSPERIKSFNSFGRNVISFSSFFLMITQMYLLKCGFESRQ